MSVRPVAISPSAARRSPAATASTMPGTRLVVATARCLPSEPTTMAVAARRPSRRVAADRALVRARRSR